VVCPLAKAEIGRDDHKTLDRLTALRGPGESYSNVILRMAKGWQLQSAPFLRNAKLLKASL
jgi:hypothetical protein